MGGNLKLLPVLVFAVLALGGADTAFAQGRSCDNLASTLRSLDGNRAFRRLDANLQEARQLESDVQDLESLFVRSGCQRQINNSGEMDRQCRLIARRHFQAQSNLEALQADIETGEAVAQQRELALQQIVRFGCDTGSGSGVTFSNRRSNSSFGNLLERLFGGGDSAVIDDYRYSYGGQSTLRTVCVRSCDGYYWPVSFSTTEEYLFLDAQQCQSQCPGKEVKLFYYHNPGENPEDMVDLGGLAYSVQPNAFRYRQEYDASCTCKASIDYGSIVIDRTRGGQSRAQIEFQGVTFPMPVRDPRRIEDVTIAELVHVPLPRRRPARPGESPSIVAMPAPNVEIEPRTVTVGSKKVRVVGPDTPYAQAAGAGS